MKKKPEAPETSNRQCSRWAEITDCLDKFLRPEMSIGYEDGVANEWVFRGLKCSSYPLQPAIEREAQDWAALEALVLSEFEARARIHLSAHMIPTDKVTWLAQMQHYGIPTRLLDFTYSPFVALYFAIRNGHSGTDRSHVRLWAVNAGAIKDRFRRVAWEAREATRKTPREEPIYTTVDAFDFASLETKLDNINDETKGLHELVIEVLGASDRHREELNRRGCIGVASPPAFNPRLVSQQGLFMFNCALGRTFKESLTRMMEGCSEWQMKIDISVDLIPEIERRLFQMNVHEHSLFPDLEGLAGLIRQKLRLHWR